MMGWIEDGYSDGKKQRPKKINRELYFKSSVGIADSVDGHGPQCPPTVLGLMYASEVLQPTLSLLLLASVLLCHRPPCRTPKSYWYFKFKKSLLFLKSCLITMETDAHPVHAIIRHARHHTKQNARSYLPCQPPQVSNLLAASNAHPGRVLDDLCQRPLSVGWGGEEHTIMGGSTSTDPQQLSNEEPKYPIAH